MERLRKLIFEIPSLLSIGNVLHVDNLKTLFWGSHSNKRNSKIRNFYNLLEYGMLGNGVEYKGKSYITHSSLNHEQSAVKTVQRHQKKFLSILALFVILSFLIDFKLSLLVLVIIISVLYFIDLLFNLFLILRSLRYHPEIVIENKEIASLEEKYLPIYTVFCPLYKEWKILPQFVEAMSKLDWPKDKLDVQLLLEEDDENTIREAITMNLPAYFRIILVPNSEPKTKPKACNYGLGHAKGEYAVIYDAEDIPDPDQLKKAYLVLSNPKNRTVVCAQSKLNFYNSNQNLLTRFFSAEYALWFNLILPGLYSIKSPIPLGGTSNHFRVKDLEILRGWDPFNVTEDCDLGIRIAKLGYQTAIINSLTMEEATSTLGNWMRQRSRWLKGYIQTYLVHMRHPQEFSTGANNSKFLIFQLVVGGKIISTIINPFLWILTISYFAFRSTVGPAIEFLYPAPVLYIAVSSLIFGNFLYAYYYMVASARIHNEELIKYLFLIPLYWLMMSLAVWKALIQLIFKPHYWEKTIHGLHLGNK